MDEREWVLIARCRSCGINSVAEIDDDVRVIWPPIIHECDCDSAGPDDLRELRRTPALARSSSYLD